MSRTLHAVLGLCASFVAATGAVYGAQWGVNGHSLTQPSYLATDLSTQMDRIVEMGAGWYRFEVRGPATEQMLSKLDTLVAEAEKHKLQLLPVLMPFPAANTKDASAEQIRSAAADFAKTVATRYKGRISHWELGNELDTVAIVRAGESIRGGKIWALGSPDGDDPGHYEQGRYLKVKAEVEGLQEGVKTADPTALTMVDFGWIHYGLLSRLINEDHAQFDIVAVHWYSNMGDMTNVRGKLNLLDELKKMRRPIWITEINRRDGSKGGNEADQARYLKDTLASLGTRGDVGAIFVYELLDEPSLGRDNGEAYYGLIDLGRDQDQKWAIGNNKPAFEAVRSAIQDAHRP